MVRAIKPNELNEFDIFLPVKDGKGRVVSKVFYATFRKLLTKKFGGVTDFVHGNIGEWKFGNVIYREQMRVFRVLAPPSHSNLLWLKKLGESLRSELSQEEILLIRRSVARVN